MGLRVNSSIYSWTSCLQKIDNSPISPLSNRPWGIVALDFEQKRERKVVYRNRQDGKPAGKTSGKYSVEGCSIKMLRESAQDLRDYLQIVKGITVTPRGSYGNAVFEIIVQVSEPVPGHIPLTYILSDCTIDGDKDAHEEGIEELVTEFTIGCLAIEVNGRNLWSDNTGLAGLLI